MAEQKKKFYAKLKVRQNKFYGVDTTPGDAWGPSWLKPDAGRVGIKHIEVNDIDWDWDGPFTNGVVNTSKNETTLNNQDFVTHEPYNRDRKSSVRQKSKFFKFGKVHWDPCYEHNNPDRIDGLTGDNEFIEMERLLYTRSTDEEYKRFDQLIKRFDIDVVSEWNPETQQYEKTGQKFGANLSEKREEFYEGLRMRQEKFSNGEIDYPSGKGC